MAGVKFDQGKDPWHLMPLDALAAVLKVIAFGAKKYGDRNWEHGMDWSRLYSAGMRHYTAWWKGEEVDEETGYSHLWHLCCCVLFLIAYQIRGIGKDDRPKEKPLPVKEEVLIKTTFDGNLAFGQATAYSEVIKDRRKQHAGIEAYRGAFRRATDYPLHPRCEPVRPPSF